MRPGTARKCFWLGQEGGAESDRELSNQHVDDADTVCKFGIGERELSSFDVCAGRPVNADRGIHFTGVSVFLARDGGFSSSGRAFSGFAGGVPGVVQV